MNTIKRRGQVLCIRRFFDKQSSLKGDSNGPIQLVPQKDSQRFLPKGAEGLRAELHREEYQETSGSVVDRRSRGCADVLRVARYAQ